MLGNVIAVMAIVSIVGFGVSFTLFFLEKKRIRELLSTNIRESTESMTSALEERSGNIERYLKEEIESGHRELVALISDVDDTSSIALNSAEEGLNIAISDVRANLSNAEESIKKAMTDDKAYTEEKLQQARNDYNSKLQDLSEQTERAKKDLIKAITDVASDSHENLQVTRTDYITKIQDLSEQTEMVINEGNEQISYRIDELEALTEEAIAGCKSELGQQIKVLATALEKINEENKILRKKLEFFTDIKDESASLNDNEDLEERERLIQQALEEAVRLNMSSGGMGRTTSTVERKTISISTEAAADQIETSISEDLYVPIEIELIDESAEIKETEDATVLDGDATNEQIGGSKPEGTGSGKKAGRISVLDDNQNRAFAIMNNTNTNLFITGVAGTGKSFLIDVFVRFTDKEVLKMAPTAIAARNIEGVTMHSVFGFYNLERIPLKDISATNLRISANKRAILKAVDVFIIDEISMVRADIIDKIDCILQLVNNNNKPFGGKQIIVLGDLFQLPPIAKERFFDKFNRAYDSAYFFNSHAYRNSGFEFVELSVNHRQNGDKRFYDILNRMREGKLTEGDISTLNSRIYKPADNDLKRLLTLVPTKEQVEEINMRALSRIPAKQYSYPAEIVYNRTNNNNPNIDSQFSINSELKLKSGAIVMMVNNDKQERWVNGNLGIVSTLGPDYVRVVINEKEYNVERTQFTEHEATVENGRVKYIDALTVSQFPIVLAYAITIHKSQGQTYPKIACDISSCFASGQAYVALSRCTSLDGLYLLNEVTRDSTIINPEVVDFYINQKNRLT